MIKRLLLFSTLMAALVAQARQPIAPCPPPDQLETLTNYELPKGNSWEDKHFREALLKGRQPKGYYCLVNNNKKISADALIDYCKSHNFIYEEKAIKYKTIKAFGTGGVRTVSEFYFIPKEVYPNYVYECGDITGIPFKSLTKKGLAYFYCPWECYMSQGTSRMGNFVFFKDALWSGNIVNGKIDGTGAGLYISDEKDQSYYFAGTFKEGIPQGKVHYNPVNYISPYEITVGEWNEGMASFQYNGRYGFLSVSDGKLNVALSPLYAKVVSDFHNGYATVVEKIATINGTEYKEMVIDKDGKFIDYSDGHKRQQQLLAEKLEKEKELQRKKELLQAEERKRQELADRQAQLDRKRIAENAENLRIEQLRNARPGDRIYYSQDWKHTELYGWVSSNYTMRVICFVEKNVNKGERLLIRVGSVESTSDYHYSTPVIDGIEYNKGDVIWIKPFENKGWHM